MTTTIVLFNPIAMRQNDRKKRSKRGAFTVVELMLAITIGGIVLAGAATSVNMWARSSMAVGNYADMSGSCRRALAGGTGGRHGIRSGFAIPGA